MVKLIFLDLDGVLVTRFPGVFDPDLVKNLKTVVDKTGAEIVLSSDWRRNPQAREDARRNLRAFGLDFIDYTPCLSPCFPQRPKEILQWKDEHHSNGGSFITAWIAIDDRPLLEEEKGAGLIGHFVKTDEHDGFSGPCVDQAIHLLSKFEKTSVMDSSQKQVGIFGGAFEKPMSFHGKVPVIDASERRVGGHREAFDKQRNFRDAFDKQWHDPKLSMPRTEPVLSNSFRPQANLASVPRTDPAKSTANPWKEISFPTGRSSNEGTYTERNLPSGHGWNVVPNRCGGSKEGTYAERNLASGQGWNVVPNRSGHDDQGKMMNFDRVRPDVSDMPRGKVLDFDRMRMDRPKPEVSMSQGKTMDPDRSGTRGNSREAAYTERNFTSGHRMRTDRPRLEVSMPERKTMDPDRSGTFDGTYRNDRSGTRGTAKEAPYTERNFTSGHAWQVVPHRSGYDDQGKMINHDRVRADACGPDRPATPPKVFDVSASATPRGRGSRPSTPPPKVIDINSLSTSTVNQGQRPQRPSTAPRSQSSTGSSTAPRSRLRFLDMESRAPEVQRNNSPSRSNPTNPILEFGGSERPKLNQVIDFLGVDSGSSNKYEEHKSYTPLSKVIDLRDSATTKSTSAKTMDLNLYASRSNQAKILDLGPNESKFSSDEPGTPRRRSASGPFPVWDFR